MNHSEIIRNFLPLRSHSAIMTMLIAAVLSLSANSHAALVSSTFDSGFDGWTGLSCINPGICSVASGPLALSHFGSGGVGESGYIEATDPSSGTAARGLAPTEILNALAVGRRLTFFANAVDVDGSGEFDSDVAPLVTIEYGVIGSGLGGTLVYGTADLPDEIGTWKFYDVTISADDPRWRYFDNLLDPVALAASERDATPDDFTAFLGTSTEAGLAERVTIIMEWLNDDADLDTGGLDSVHIVPVPAALPLILSALFGLGLTARRRS